MSEATNSVQVNGSAFGRPVHVAAIADEPGIAKRHRIAIGALSRILAGIKTENKYLIK
jgi:hypothetical protein